MGFSGYQNVNKEISSYLQTNVYYTPGLMFWGVFCRKCDRDFIIGRIKRAQMLKYKGR